MRDEASIPVRLLIELARQRGLVLDSARASELRPQLESLLRGLASIGERLPFAAPPAPGGLPGPPR